MTGWEILELEPTNDLNEIRKAYARKAKKFHPEDDPEGFRRLYDAYQWAQSQARHLKWSKSMTSKGEMETELIHRLSIGPSWKSLEKYKSYREIFPTREIQSYMRRRKHTLLPILGMNGMDFGMIFQRKGNISRQEDSEIGIDFDEIFERVEKKRQEQGMEYRYHSSAAQDYIRIFEQKDSSWEDWEKYILGKKFLQAQYTPEYIYFLTTYLKEQHGDSCPMPYNWIVALFVAYSISGDISDLLQQVVAPLWDLFFKQRHSKVFSKELSKEIYIHRRNSFSYYNRACVLCKGGSSSRELAKLLSEMEKDEILMKDSGHHALFTYLAESLPTKDILLRNQIYESFNKKQGKWLLQKYLARWRGQNNST